MRRSLAPGRCDVCNRRCVAAARSRSVGDEHHDALGRSGSPGHLDRHLRYAAATTRAIRGQRVPHGRGGGCAGHAAVSDPSARSPRAAGQRAGCVWRLQRRVRIGEANQPANLAHRGAERRAHSWLHLRSAHAPGLPIANINSRSCRRRRPARSRSRRAAAGNTDLRRREELRAPPIYNTDRLNRSDGPEDSSLAERCLGAVLPDFSGYRRIVQSPTSVAIFYDTGQGQGWQRIIPVSAKPASSCSGPAAVRRFAWPVGGEDVGRRRHQFQPEDRLSRIARAPAPRRTLDATRCHDARVCRDGRGSDDMGAVLDRETGTESAGRAGEPDLLTSRAVTREISASAGMLINSRAEERAFAAGEGAGPRHTGQLDGRSGRRGGKYRSAGRWQLRSRLLIVESLSIADC